MNDFQLALAAYLARDDSAECDLAAAVGRSQAAINRYRNGKRFPDAETARAIETRTDGEVPFSAWQADFLARSGLAPDVAMPAPAQASDTACVDEGRQVLCGVCDDRVDQGWPACINEDCPRPAITTATAGRKAA